MKQNLEAVHKQLNKLDQNSNIELQGILNSKRQQELQAEDKVNLLEGQAKAVRAQYVTVRQETIQLEDQHLLYQESAMVVAVPRSVLHEAASTMHVP